MTMIYEPNSIVYIHYTKIIYIILQNIRKEGDIYKHQNHTFTETHLHGLHKSRLTLKNCKIYYDSYRI